MATMTEEKIETRKSAKLSAENHSELNKAAFGFGMPVGDVLDEAVGDWLKRNRRRIDEAVKARIGSTHTYTITHNGKRLTKHEPEHKSDSDGDGELSGEHAR